MHLKDGWVVAIAIVAFIAGLIVGVGLIADAYASDCTIMGKFSIHERVYQCSPVGKKGD